MIVLAIVTAVLTALGLLGRSTVERLRVDQQPQPLSARFQPGTTRVEFDSVDPGTKIVGNLYVPDADDGSLRAGIVVAPPASSVKEQSAHNYARRLRERGYVALTFDPRGIGETEGIEANANPSKVANDISSAVTFLSSLPQVDPERIGNLGICAQASSTAFESERDQRVKALGLVSPSVDGAELAGGTFFLTRWGVYIFGGIVRLLYAVGIHLKMPAFPETDEELADATPMQQGMASYYPEGKPGGHPRWKNALSMTSIPGIASLHIIDHTDEFNDLPVHIETGERAQSLEPAERFFVMLDGPAEKTMNKIEGSDHFDLYWKDEYVDQAVERLDDFYRRHLSGPDAA